MEASSVGKVNSNVKSYILDAEHRRVPIGAIGELYFSGYQLSSGYLNNPEKNAESFFDNPFSNEEGYERIYNTGDFCRLLSDGTIGLLGRRDGQVKIRGNRVETREVEACIRDMPGVSDVTVQAITMESGSKELCAYIVQELGAKVSITDVQSYVSERKPDYMVPAFLIQIDSIPLNVNGKVDSRALPKPDLSSLKKEFVAPTNDAERIICDAFSEVLGMDRIGIDDDFVRLGGDSLKAIKVVSISRSSGMEVRVSDILSGRTPRGIVSVTSKTSSVECIYSIETGCPLTGGALDVYLDVESGKSDSIYVIDSVYPIPEGTSDAQAKEIINQLLEVHPILRSRLVMKDGIPWYSFDARPEVTISDSPVEDIRKPFALSESLCRFHIVSGKSIQAAFHHTVFDGLSVSIIQKTLESLFSGKRPEHDVGFLRDASLFAASDSAESERFFREMLSDVPDDTILIPDADGCVGNRSIVLSESPESISEASRRIGSTPANMLAAAFGYTLSRFTGSSIALFSHIVNGRDLTSSEDSVGMFVRTLPIVLDCNDRLVSEFVSESSDRIFGTISNQLCPFHQIATDMGVGFSIVFNHLTGIEQYGDAVRDGMDESDIVGDLTFNLIRTPDSYILSYNHSSKYSEDTASRMASAFDRVVSGLMSCQRLSEIQFTSEEDIRILEKMNDTSKKLQYDDILDAFRHHVSVSPDSILLRYLDNIYSYADVDRISDSVASALESQGIGPGDSVAIFVPRSEWYLLCAMGVLKAGTAYVPIDTSYPDERVSFMISDSAAKAVLVTPDTLGRIPSRIPLIDCTVLPQSRFHPRESESRGAAVILYTSGTTGTPRGAVITRLAVENYSEFYSEVTAMSSKDVVALYHSIGFDVHLESMLSPIIAGASVSIVPENVRLDMDALDRFITDHGITNLHLPAAVGRMFVEKHPNSDLHLLVVGGEKFGESRNDVGYDILEKYGPTECTVSVSYVDAKRRKSPDSLGALIPNTSAYILDAEHRRVPVGAVGELYISGYQLSSGYLNNSEKNAESFFDNPFSDDEGYEKMYATGDFFRLLSDGTLSIIGRRDGQVKIRGNRVELTEVEACIRSMPGVSDVTVQVFISDNSSKELCAYIVNDPSSSVSEEDIQSFISTRKPEYMIPSFVIKLDSIPLNVNGKVDKRALPEPDMSSLKKEYAAPRNDVERALCDSLSAALGIERVGIDDDFIRLGGDSLKAIKAVSACRSSGIEIKARDIITLRTARNIAATVSSAVDMGSSEGEIGLTPMHELFLGSGSEEERDSYIQSMDLECLKPITIDILQRSVDNLTDRHDILRAIYDDKPRIREKGFRACSVEEVEASSDEDMLSASSSALKVLSMREGRLMGCLLISMDGRQYIRLMINHMAVDGVSWNILLSDLSECISAYSQGREPSLPPRTMPIRDWIAKGYAPTPAERRYWDSVPQIDNSLIDEDAKPYTFNLDASDLSNPYGLEASDILLTAFAEAYRDVTGGDPVIRMEGHGRDHGVEHTVGWFTCLYPLSLHTTGDPIADLFAVRKARRSVPKGGRGYGYLHKDLPSITYNYLSSAFSYNDGTLFSVTLPSNFPSGPKMGKEASFDIMEKDGGYTVTGYCPASLDISACMQERLDSIVNAFTGPRRIPVTGPALDVYLDEIAGDKGTAYSTIGMFPIPKGKSEEDVISAIHAVIEAHPVLSTRISLIDGEPWIVPGKEPEVEPISDVPFIRPFILSESLCRFRIVPGYIQWAIHHVILDAETKRLIIGEFRKVFSGKPLSKEEGYLLSATDSPDADYISDAIDYFDSVIDGAAEVPVPDHGGQKETMEVPLNIKASDIPKGITPGGFFASAFGYTLGRLTGSSRTVFPITENGRDIPGTENALGMFARTFPAVIDCTDRSVADFISSSSESILASMSRSKVPYKDIARRYGMGMTVFFEYFADINADIRSITSCARTGSDGFTPLDSRFSLCADSMSDLFAMVHDTGDGFIVALMHSEKYSDAFCRRFLDSYCETVSGLLSCDRLSEIHYTSEEAKGGSGRMVRIRGNMVELSEVEDCIRTAAGIVEVTSQTVVAEGGIQEICAYIVEDDSVSMVEDDVKKHVSSIKPDYMVPAFVIQLDRIPEKADGTVDRCSLPIPERPSPRGDFVAPRNDAERRICEVFSKVLNMDSIGIDDDFLRLGGDSLTAVKAAAILYSEYSLDVDVCDILRHRTVRQITENR